MSTVKPVKGLGNNEDLRARTKPDVGGEQYPSQYILWCRQIDKHVDKTYYSSVQVKCATGKELRRDSHKTLADLFLFLPLY